MSAPSAWGRQNEYDKAIADYNSAIDLDPMDAESFYNRAWAWQQKGDNAGALPTTPRASDSITI